MTIPITIFTGIIIMTVVVPIIMLGNAFVQIIIGLYRKYKTGKFSPADMYKEN